jgi:hypothetical protein
MNFPPFEIVYLKSAESPVHAEPKQFESGRLADDADYFDWYAFAKLLSEWQQAQSAIREAVR